MLPRPAEAGAPASDDGGEERVVDDEDEGSEEEEDEEDEREPNILGSRDCCGNIRQGSARDCSWEKGMTESQKGQNC